MCYLKFLIKYPFEINFECTAVTKVGRFCCFPGWFSRTCGSKDLIWGWAWTQDHKPPGEAENWVAFYSHQKYEWSGWLQTCAKTFRTVSWWYGVHFVNWKQIPYILWRVIKTTVKPGNAQEDEKEVDKDFMFVVVFSWYDMIWYDMIW